MSWSARGKTRASDPRYSVVIKAPAWNAEFDVVPQMDAHRGADRDIGRQPSHHQPLQQLLDPAKSGPLTVRAALSEPREELSSRG